MTGAPELAVEVCLSSRSYDPGPKRLLYQSAGVTEYLAAIVEDERLDWRVLDGGRYRLLKPHRDGTFRWQVFLGLWLDAGAYWRCDWPALLATLERGLGAAAAAKAK